MSAKQPTLIPLTSLPACDIGAPLPTVLASEDFLHLLYIASEPDPGFDGTNPRVVGPNTGGVPVVTLTFRSAVAHQLSLIPDEENYSGHYLAPHGFEPYQMFEVPDSPWLVYLERIRSARPSHWFDRMDSVRHYIFGFHDSTFECAARSYSVAVTRGSVLSRVVQLANSHDRGEPEEA